MVKYRLSAGDAIGKNIVGYTYSLEEILVELSNKLPDGALTIPEPTYNWGYGNANPDVGKIEEVRKN
ncbi:MAG: hypothetical protein K6F50_00580 [Kiritimatiellae bacterium]|nr:hypothetical protein [Kiritimatiellia bacterium]